MVLGELLRQRRDALGLTLSEVAEACGLGKSHIHAIEQGRHPNPGILTCARLSIALGISVQLIATASLNSAIGGAPTQRGEHDGS